MNKTLGFLFLMLTAASSAWGQGKLRVAIMDFDYSTVQSDSAKIFRSDQDVGKGITNLMLTRLSRVVYSR